MADDRRTMMTGMFRDRRSAERAYGSLADRRFYRDDVSLLMSVARDAGPDASSKKTTPPAPSWERRPPKGPA